MESEKNDQNSGEIEEKGDNNTNKFNNNENLNITSFSTNKISENESMGMKMPINLGNMEKTKCIVIDTGAIVKGETKSFHRYGQKFYTVQEVLSEVRDLKSRDVLASLPFELEIKTPTDNAMHIVYEFAKKTGDFAALSLCDLKIIALTYDLEIEAHQQQFLRKAPQQISHAIPPQAQKNKISTSKKELTKESNVPPDQPCCCDEQDYIVRDEDSIPGSSIIDWFSYSCDRSRTC